MTRPVPGLRRTLFGLFPNSTRPSGGGPGGLWQQDTPLRGRPQRPAPGETGRKGNP